MGFVQTETPYVPFSLLLIKTNSLHSYYQPNPTAPAPWTVNTAINDPNFASSCSGQSGTCANAWGLRVLNSKNIEIYGMGLYSFFNNWSTTCSNNGGADNCQNNIFSIESGSSLINVYGYSSVGVVNMITKNGATVAVASRIKMGSCKPLVCLRVVESA